MKQSDLAELTAADIMHPDIVAVDARDSIAEVEHVLVDNNISGMPVIAESGQVIGIVSWRDLVAHLSEGPSLSREHREEWYKTQEDDDRYRVTIPEDDTTVAEDLMTPLVHTVPGSMRLPEVARTMTRVGIHRVLVVDGGGAFVGIISTMEFLRAIAELTDVQRV